MMAIGRPRPKAREGSSGRGRWRLPDPQAIEGRREPAYRQVTEVSVRFSTVPVRNLHFVIDGEAVCQERYQRRPTFSGV